MALTQQEKQIVDQLKAEGYTNTQIIEHIGATRAGRPSEVNELRKEASFLQSIPERQGRFSDVGEDITSTFGGTKESLQQRLTDVTNAMALPGQIAARHRAGGGTFLGSVGRGFTAMPETALTAGANVIGGAFDIVSAPVFAAGKAALSQEEEEALAETAGQALEATGLPETVAELPERGQRGVRTALASLDALGLGLFGKIGGSLARTMRKSANKQTKTQVDETVAQVQQSLERQAEDVNLTPKQREEAARSALTFQERYIGLTPDIKKRLEEMGLEKLQEYLDATHLRNIDDTVPTPYEIGARNVDQALISLDKELRRTGSQIGQTRQKLANVKASNRSIRSIEETFANELDKLGLKTVNGQVVPKGQGQVSRLSSPNDLKVINELYNEMRVFKQNPTLDNAVALRVLFDNKVKFGKEAREVSGDVDPLSRSVRSEIADQINTIVGKEGAADVENYSKFINAYQDLRSYTDRRAGGEYLLRVVLSGRGGEARELIQTIDQYTGKNLLNDATAMKVAVDTLGNDQTKNLFRQEIQNAGYDATSFFTGGVAGLVPKAVGKVVDVAIDPEEVLKRAAAGGAAIGTTYLLVEDQGVLELAPIVAIGSMTPQARRLAAKEIDDFIARTEKQAAQTTNKNVKNRLENAITAAKKEKATLLED